MASRVTKTTAKLVAATIVHLFISFIVGSKVKLSRVETRPHRWSKNDQPTLSPGLARLHKPITFRTMSP